MLLLSLLTLTLCLNATMVGRRGNNNKKNKKKKRSGAKAGGVSGGWRTKNKDFIRMEEATETVKEEEEEEEEEEEKRKNDNNNNNNNDEGGEVASESEGGGEVHVMNVIGVGYSVHGGKRLIGNMNMTVWSGVDIDGVRPGVMAVMGPSGAGKTTFLDVISGRKSDGEVEGRVMLDGLQLDAQQRSRLFGYVMQEEPMLSCLTVRETLRFAADLRSRKRFSGTKASDNAALRMCSFCTSPFCCCSCVWNASSSSCCSSSASLSSSYWSADDEVEHVMDMLSIGHIADVRVGSTSERTLSGGERKRVSVGTELVVDPPVLLLDEPTTGLDAASAMSVMNVLHDLVEHHSRVVIATIHQPRVDIWNRLGGVTVVSPLGTIVYTGPASNAPTFFTLDGELCRYETNPADHM